MMAFSSIIYIKVELWSDLKDVSLYLIIGEEDSNSLIKLLYTNWWHNSPLFSWKNLYVKLKNCIKKILKKIFNVMSKESERPLKR